MEIEPITLKMLKWKADDNGNNDAYDSRYAYDMIFTIDEGESSSISEEQLTLRFIEKSMEVLHYREEDWGCKLEWQLVKKRDGEYSIEFCEKEYIEDWEGYSQVLTKLSFTTENVFELK